MNALTKLSQAPAVTEGQMIDVLRNSLYPGAKDESVALVLAWCRATGRDPMKKPVHIVPMNVKVSRDKWQWQDVLMPGIGTYRTDAARTGEYAGKTEPEFGPDETRTLGSATVTFPKWCKVTVKRIVAGSEREFTALEYWIENYATKGKDDQAPNAMWFKRPYGQLAKCAESQALCMAFPEETGNTNTAEEMEGKSFEGVTLDAKAEPVAPASRSMDATLNGDVIPDFDAPKPDRLRKVADRIKERLAAATDQESYNAVMGHAGIAAEWDKIRSSRAELDAELEAFRVETLTRIAEATPPPADTWTQDESEAA